MIDQKLRLRKNGKNFSPKFSREVGKSLKRRNTIFTVISSENNHNTTFLKEFQEDLIGSMKRQSRSRSSCSLFIDVKGKDTLEDSHYEKANFNVIIKSLNKNYNTFYNQLRRLDQKARFGFLIACSSIIILLTISSYKFNVKDLSTPTLQELAGIFLTLLGVLSFFTFIPKLLKDRIAKKKKEDASFSFEKKQIIQHLKKKGLRKNPSTIIIDNAELLDEDPFNFLLDLFKTDIGSNQFGLIWVFLFTSNSDNLDELVRESREKKYTNHILELKPYSKKELQEILESNPDKELEGNYIVSKDEKKKINQLKRKWVDLTEKNDNKSVFSEYDILKIIAFSGNRHHIERWNPNLINELFISAPESIINTLNTHLGYNEATKPNYFELATNLKSNEDFFQSKRFATGYYVVPYKLRIILENSLDKESRLLIQLFWIQKYLNDYEKGAEDLLAKRILYRINIVKQLYLDIYTYEELIQKIRTAIISLLDNLFARLSFRTFLQFFKALNQLNSLVIDKDFTLIEKKRLAQYSAYLYELSGDSHFEPAQLYGSDQNVPFKTIFSTYRKLLAKQSPALLLKELDETQNLERIKEQPWLHNLYYLLLLFLRIRETDGFVFKLRKDVSVTTDLALPMESEFPVFEMRYRFLLLDVYMEQENVESFLRTFEELMNRILQIESRELALRTLLIYWRALAVHYWLAMQKKDSEGLLQKAKFETFLQDQKEIEMSYKWVANQYVDAEFLFEHLDFRLPLIDLFYSQGQLLKDFTSPIGNKISNWYANWFGKFKSSILIQHQINLSFNIPEIYIRIFESKQSLFGTEKCINEINTINQALSDHSFNDRIRLYWKYRELTVQNSLSKKEALRLSRELIQHSKKNSGDLSYAFSQFKETNIDMVVELYLKRFMLDYLEHDDKYEEAKELFNSLENEFYEFIQSKALTPREIRLLDDTETMILQYKVRKNSNDAARIYYELKNKPNILKSTRFPHFLGLLIEKVPSADLDYDILNFYIQRINSQFSSYSKKSVFGDFLNIIYAIEKSSYDRYPRELKDNIKKLVKNVISTDDMIVTTSVSRLEKIFGILLALDSSDEFYVNQWYKWCQLNIESFVLDRLESVYNEKSSYEIFQIYIDFFKKYEDVLPFQKYYSKKLIDAEKKIVEQLKSDDDSKQFVESVFDQLKKFQSPLISGGEINKLIWNYSYYLSSYSHHLNDSEKAAAKEILNDIFSPSIITDYLKIVVNIKSLNPSLRQTINELIEKHQANKYKLKAKYDSKQ